LSEPPPLFLSHIVLRIRPLNDHDITFIPPRFQRIALSASSPTTVSIDSGSSIGTIKKPPQQFHYDRVLGSTEGQQDLYEAAAERLVGKFLDGFNVTILAYVLFSPLSLSRIDSN
jgi:hypothetical protein